MRQDWVNNRFIHGVFDKAVVGLFDLNESREQAAVLAFLVLRIHDPAHVVVQLHQTLAEELLLGIHVGIVRTVELIHIVTKALEVFDRVHHVARGINQPLQLLDLRLIDFMGLDLGVESENFGMEQLDVLVKFIQGVSLLPVGFNTLMSFSRCLAFHAGHLLHRQHQGNTGTGLAESAGIPDGRKDRFDHGVANQEKNHLRADVQAESEKRFRLAGTRPGGRDDGRTGGTGLFGRIDDPVGQVRLHHCKDAFIGHWLFFPPLSDSRQPTHWFCGKLALVMFFCSAARRSIEPIGHIPGH
jgi:hypothetical protein